MSLSAAAKSRRGTWAIAQHFSPARGAGILSTERNFFRLTVQPYTGGERTYTIWTCASRAKTRQTIQNILLRIAAMESSKRTSLFHALDGKANQFAAISIGEVQTLLS